MLRSIPLFKDLSDADLALIGGTLLPFGGQNLIEAAACGCPVLVGPHTFIYKPGNAGAHSKDVQTSARFDQLGLRRQTRAWTDQTHLSE